MSTESFLIKLRNFFRLDLFYSKRQLGQEIINLEASLQKSLIAIELSQQEISATLKEMKLYLQSNTKKSCKDCRRK